MKKLLALAIGAALVGGGLGGSWYTGNAFDRLMAEQIAEVKKTSNVDVQWLPGSSGLFKRDGVLKLVLTEEDLASLDSGLAAHNGAIEIPLVVKSQILPLYIKSQYLLDTRQGALAPLFTALGMQEWQLGGESVTSLWTKGNSTRFWAQEFKVKQAEGEFHFLPLEGDYHGDLDGNGHITLTWQGMTLHEEQNKLDVVLADVKGRADIAKISGVLLAPQSDMSVSALTMTLPDSTKFSLEGLTSSSQLKGNDAQTLSSGYRMDIAKMKLENEGDNLAVTQTRLALDLNGIDLEGYQGLQAAGGESIDNSAVQQALDKILKRGASLELADLSANINGEAVKMKGDMTLSSTSLDELTNSDTGMAALSGNLHASLSAKLKSALPEIAPFIDQLTAMGYLKADKEQLTSELKLEKGAVTVNGLPL